MLTQVKPALELRRALDAGALFTRLAEDKCGQAIHADVSREGPPWLTPDEYGDLQVDPARELIAALRRAGHLVQSDGRQVACITSVVAVGRLPHELVCQLTTTTTPLGKVLGEDVGSKVLWTSPGIDEYAVHCRRLIFWQDRPVALAIDRVLWSWVDSLP
jgi:hypothetical protein